MTEMIVAVFDNPVTAEAAVREVEAIGLPSAVVRRYDKADPELTRFRSTESKRSFWSWLFGEEPGPAEHAVYDRSIEAGGIVVTVSVDEAQADRVMEALNRHGPIDIEQRAAEYGVASPGVASRMGTSAYDTAAVATPVAGTPGAGVSASRTGAQATEEVIPLAEEKLEVGKRVVDRGMTRIRRYVVRTPVEQTVSLHEEQVTIERRKPVAGGVAGAPEGAFEGRETEVRTTAEEPVVTKTPRVAEEVVIRKEGRDRTETVRDTVRREEVQVEKQGGKPTDVARTEKDATAAPRTPGGQAPLPPAE